MPEDNHYASQKDVIGNSAACSSMEVIEFNWPLFVYQGRARGGEELLFTIGVWNGTKLMPICHLQPFQTALDALGQALIKAGRSQSVSTVSSGSDSNGVNTGGHEERRSGAESHSSAAGDNGRP